MPKLKIPQTEAIINGISKLIIDQETSAFNKRDVGLKLQTFLRIFTISICFMTNVTLEGLSIKCEEMQYGLRITKQALQKRLKTGKKELKALLSSTVLCAMSYEVEKPKVARALEQFAAVIITDATTISLPDKLATFHKGLGGTNAKSAMKIQASYDVKSKSFRKIDQRSDAKENDASYMKELINEIKANELSITDLGYYGVSHFKKIAEKGAYFISKIKSNTNLYTESDKSINLVRELRRKDFIDKCVVIKGDGGKTSMVVRICGIKLPPTVYAERIRKANKKAKSSSKSLTKEERERLKWILIITNITEDMLDSQSICELYRIRWQIELIFKSWKSHFAIDEMNNVGKDYWDCLLYGKLIVITMLTALHSHFDNWSLRLEDRGISFLRFMNNMRENLAIILDYMLHKISCESLVVALSRIVCASLLEKRKRKTSEQAINDFNLPSDRFSCISDFHSVA
jgi:hypothetical protein